MRLIRIENNFDDHFETIYNFCDQAVNELKNSNIVEEQTIINMSIENWETNIHCLLYRMFIKRDFDNNKGMLNLLYDDNNKPIFISGVLKYNNEISTLGKRTFCSNKYRNKGIFHYYVLDDQIKWSVDKGMRACLLLFNEHTKNLFFTLARIKQGKIGHIGSPHYKYMNFEYLPNKYKIYNTEQYVAVYKIDKNFDVGGIQWEI
jgi:hypothetical protein